MIIAIVGLVLFYALPWITVTGKISDKERTGNWDQDLKWRDGDKEMKTSMGDPYYEGNSEFQKHLKDTIGMSFLGLLKISHHFLQLVPR